MANHSPEGMCFKSALRFNSGTTVLVRIDGDDQNLSATDVLEGLRTISLGTVQWCQEIPEEQACWYETGLKYLPPVY